jgi:hypothetical protein
MPTSAAQRLAMLRENHIPARLLSPVLQETWAGLAVGLTDAEIGQIAGLSEHTIRGRASDLIRAVTDGSQLAATRAVAADLFWAHLDCCTRELKKLIESGQVLVPVLSDEQGQ